jgi:hypothetical protein
MCSCWNYWNKINDLERQQNKNKIITTCVSVVIFQAYVKSYKRAKIEMYRVCENKFT